MSPKGVSGGFRSLQRKMRRWVVASGVENSLLAPDGNSKNAVTSNIVSAARRSARTRRKATAAASPQRSRAFALSLQTALKGRVSREITKYLCPCASPSWDRELIRMIDTTRGWRPTYHSQSRSAISTENADRLAEGEYEPRGTRFRIRLDPRSRWHVR
jgi:hypothetical protein